MPAERTVACPSCGATRRTKAQRGLRLVCSKCGRAFRAPAQEPAQVGVTIEDQPPAPPPGDEDPAGAGATAPPAGPAGSKVVHLDRAPKVPQRARPRDRGGDPSPAGEHDGRHPLATPDDHPAKAAGRRGGRRGGAALYRSGVRGG